MQIRTIVYPVFTLSDYIRMPCNRTQLWWFHSIHYSTKWMVKFTETSCTTSFTTKNWIVPLQLAYTMKIDYDMGGVSGYGTGLIALLPPKKNISSRGFVPVTQQVFTITLPCSGLESAEVKLSVKLNVTAPPGSRYNDIILVFRRNKICMKGEDLV